MDLQLYFELACKAAYCARRGSALVAELTVGMRQDLGPVSERLRIDTLPLPATGGEDGSFKIGLE